MSDAPDRTPMVIVELQLRPVPPDGTVPHFWGAGMLTFYTAPILVGAGRPKVWEADLSALPFPKRVEWRDGFGWVLIIEYTHDEAKRILAGMGLPECVVGTVPS